MRLALSLAARAHFSKVRTASLAQRQRRARNVIAPARGFLYTAARDSIIFPRVQPACAVKGECRWSFSRRARPEYNNPAADWGFCPRVVRYIYGAGCGLPDWDARELSGGTLDWLFGDGWGTLFWNEMGLGWTIVGGN